MIATSMPVPIFESFGNTDTIVVTGLVEIFDDCVLASQACVEIFFLSIGTCVVCSTAKITQIERLPL